MAICPPPSVPLPLSGWMRSPWTWKSKSLAAYRVSRLLGHNPTCVRFEVVRELPARRVCALASLPQGEENSRATS